MCPVCVCDKSLSKDITLSGFGIIDYKILCNKFSLVLCPVCECETLALQEECLVLSAFNLLIYFFKNTCEKVGQGFEVNKRIVYSVLLLEICYTGMEKFTALMFTTKNNYEQIINQLTSAAKEILKR